MILDCIGLAMQAPTASNAQDWRRLVITDADKRAAIADIYRSVGARYLARARFRPAARPPAESVTFWDGWGHS